MNIQIPKSYLPIFEPKRNKVLSGGRGSGKTETVARYLLLSTIQNKERILCTREFQNSISDSVHKTLADVIDLYKLSFFKITQNSIINKATNSEFIFKGIRHNTNEIKSMKGITKVWCEESQSLTQESLKILIPTIREVNSELLFTFNRLKEREAVYEMFCRYVSDDVWYLHTTYRDNPFFPEVLEKERLKCLRDNPQDYNHIWEGHPATQSDKSVFNRIEVIEATERDIEAVGQEELGVDVARFGADKTVITKRKGLKLVSQNKFAKLDTIEVATKVIELANFNKKMVIKVDDTGVGGGVTDQLKKWGYNVIPLNFGASPKNKDKYNNLISEAWFEVKQNIKDIQLIKDDELFNELVTREWKIDNKGRRCIESKTDYKKRGYKSPDKADSFLICFYNPSRYNLKYNKLNFTDGLEKESEY